MSRLTWQRKSATLHEGELDEGVKGLIAEMDAWVATSKILSAFVATWSTGKVPAVGAKIS